MKLKKQICILLALSMVLALAGCRDKERDTDITETAGTETTTSAAATAAEPAHIIMREPEKLYEPFEIKLYNPIGTGIKRPDDYAPPELYYSAYGFSFLFERRLEFLFDKEVQAAIYNWVDNAEAELEAVLPDFHDFLAARGYADFVDYAEKNDAPQFDGLIRYDVTAINGYLFVLVCIPVRFADFESDDRFYYDFRSAVFDLFTGEELAFSDLFFEGEEFMPILNGVLEKELGKARWYGYPALKREFAGLPENSFGFDGYNIILPLKNPYFQYGGLLQFNLLQYETTAVLKSVLSVPRNMDGIFLGNMLNQQEIPILDNNGERSGQNEN